MRYWLLMFRPDTYEVVKEKGLIGVRPGLEKRFGKLNEGDRFVAYISRKQLLDGCGRIVGSPFSDTTPIEGWPDNYTTRCSVEFDTTGNARPVGDHLWGLKEWYKPGFQLKTTPTNMLFCRGGFMEIDEEDFNNLLKVIG